MESYKQKERAYFTNIRFDLIALIPKNANARILELGAGGGDTLVAIKSEGLAKEVVGIELNPLPGSNQEHSSIDKFLFGNIETMDIPFGEGYFDAIICGDVLEHLIDPWAVVEKATKYLKTGGLLITSIPNIRYYGAMFEIFGRGNFRYTEHGLFDKTHLRFFCRKDMVRLLSIAKMEVSTVYPIFELLPDSRIRTLNRITFGLFEEFLSMQFVIVTKKTA
jgi:2-polyprenyl-3-methyl-5-hydroxy-6-metoxy-1,4-benzoquinol methylase